MKLTNTTTVTHVSLNLTADEAQKLQALVAAVPVNTTDDFFDNLADGLEQQLQYRTVYFEKDKNGEYGPPKYRGCGCGGTLPDDFDVNEFKEAARIVGEGANAELEGTLGGY